MALVSRVINWSLTGERWLVKVNWG